MSRRILLPAAALLLSALQAAAAQVPLVWHVETLSGKVVTSQDADRPVNPASVIKVATTLWALEKLGPDHRFETRFLVAAPVRERALAGDLFVQGAGDPDFHPENAFLVAQALNRRGIDLVEGSLVVGDLFWLGWEGGSEKTVTAPGARAERMAVRLRQALDPDRWTRTLRRTWNEFADRRGLDASRPPQVRIGAGVRVGDAPAGAALLVLHRSKPLHVALRRFNCYSNNDIERIGELLGEPADLQALLEERLDAAPGSVDVSTTSGLGRNRLTPRLMVRLLRELRRTTDAVGVEPELLLPVAGCDPGTLEESFPSLSSGPRATSVVAKTGTLLRTDGGVAVLVGFARVQGEELLFSVAAPASGDYLLQARRQQDLWVADLIDRNGGANPRTCSPALPMPDEGAEVRIASEAALGPPEAGPS